MLRLLSVPVTRFSPVHRAEEEDAYYPHISSSPCSVSLPYPPDVTGGTRQRKVDTGEWNQICGATKYVKSGATQESGTEEKAGDANKLPRIRGHLSLAGSDHQQECLWNAWLLVEL